MLFAEQCGVFMVWVVRKRHCWGCAASDRGVCGYVSGGYGRGRDRYGHGERDALVSHCPNFGEPGLS